MSKKLVNKIKEVFEEKLQAKTGWGKNEVIKLHDESCIEALMEVKMENNSPFITRVKETLAKDPSFINASPEQKGTRRNAMLEAMVKVIMEE